MRAAQITPQKVQNIIEGVEAAGREVRSIEIDGIVVNLSSAEVEEEQPAKGLGPKKWSKS